MKKIVIESRLVTRNTGITGYFENLLKKLLLIHPENEYILVTDDSEKLKKKIKFKCKIVEIINKNINFNHFLISFMELGYFRNT